MAAAAASAGAGGENGNASSSSSDHKDEKEGSPSPKEAGAGPSSAKRKKTASGSGGSTSSKDGSVTTANMPPLVHNGPDGPDKMAMDKLGPLTIDHIEQMKEGLMPLPPGLLPPGGPSPGGGGGGDKGSPGGGGGSAGIANYVPNQRLEWKRYKQYTRNDIMAAIEEVKSGMSALQASRKYGVPSRTLYDKVDTKVIQ